MSLTTNQAFAKFLEDISATDYQKNTTIPARKKTAIKTLEEAFPDTSDLPFWNAHLIGSAAKNTIIRPIDDVDVLAVFSNKKKAWDKYWNDSKSFLYRIRRAYDGISVQQVGARGQAVRVFFNQGGHVDVAPVFLRDGDVYHLPAGDGTWILTAPLKATAWFLDRHRVLSYNLSPLVRLLKKWNKAHSKRLRSFHLETMVATIFSSLNSNRQDAIWKFFQWAPQYLDVMDPGGQSGVLSSYLSSTARVDVVASFASAATRAENAIKAENGLDHEEAKRLWNIMFGGDFPTS
ncbi:MAG: SMODS domain-containing nucleotidyltransferase [Fimbriimonadaceae bacterium]